MKIEKIKIILMVIKRITVDTRLSKNYHDLRKDDAFTRGSIDGDFTEVIARNDLHDYYVRH